MALSKGVTPFCGLLLLKRDNLFPKTPKLLQHTTELKVNQLSTN